MQLPRISMLLAFAIVVQAGDAWADDSAAAAARMERAEQASSLDTSGLKPWHLKLTVSLSDAKGQPQEQGSIEEWWAAPSRQKVVYRTPSSIATELRNERGTFRSPGGAGPSMIVTELLDQVVHPLPARKDVDSSRPESRKQDFGKAVLECIMLSQPIRTSVPTPFGLLPTYCFDPGKDVLRASYNLGSQVVIRNRLGTFQSRNVALEIAITSSGVVVATGQVQALTSGPAAEIDLSDESGLEVDSPHTAKIGSSVMAGTILSKQQPVYPASARQRHATGSVMMQAIIGRDGRIERLKLISFPDPDLALAALAAVRQWTYHPYLLDGKPVEVDTTIAVNFYIGPG